ncbi:HAD family hydrolase [candidate division KSB3 bacterium]|uniref:HAD family hydrolase n=1 Tax=candidate division KSB3 bacterium TaxID=2044937 RepID=A0A2G6KJS0_9BACT|nr:MAG: HAD family hydrolase [candidate division KSB3 bacterium]
MTRKNILFDLDGTLLDPREGITKSIQYALKKLERPVPSIDELTWCIGPPLLENFKVLFKSDDDALAQEAIALYRERFADIGIFENEIYEGIPDILETLQKQGYRLLIATSKPSVFATNIVEHFELAQYFHKVYGSRLNGELCHKTELLPYILEQEHLQKEQTIMIGDRKHDILGAKSCGLRSLGVIYGYGGRKELLEAGADFLAECPSEILDILL